MGNKFTFAISLSVLDHLGRNLYRNFATVLGEAISNSWDANADNVWIYVEKGGKNFFIKDDGDGMTANDFQNKFLKIGYSKRKSGEVTSPVKGRPYIGRKGIGKLALLSCAEKITVISKTKGGEYIGGLVINSDLDKAITDDLLPSDYPLEDFNLDLFSKYTKGQEKGTILYFENVREGMKKALDSLRQIIALNFRFSLLDKSFNIFLEDKMVTINDIADLAENTEFLWKINGFDKDPYTRKLKKLKESKEIEMEGETQGFIASVIVPKDLKIKDTDSKVSIDLFVNGRLREKDVLKHISSTRVVESYLYGQIHFNSLDDEVDRFTTSREGVISEDEKYKDFLENLKKVISGVLQDWDGWRRKSKNHGDPENKSISLKERRAGELFHAVSKEYEIKEDPDDPEKKKKVDTWVAELCDDASFNLPAYTECFISENLIRRHIEEENIPLTPEAHIEVTTRKNSEDLNKGKGNLSIDIRRVAKDSNYLSMDHLANLVDKGDPTREACLSRDANEYKPVRDALMHTALLTEEAKQKLTTVKENIKGRVKNLLS